MEAIANRDYQIVDYKNITKAFEEKLSVVYQAPTGSGKSVVIAQYVMDKIALGNKVLFLVNRTHLQNQMYRRLKDLGVESVGVYNSSNSDNLKCQVVLMTIQTAIALQNFNAVSNTKFDNLIIDECHRSITKSYMDVVYGLLAVNPAMNLLGVTATPNRFDMKPLDTLYGAMIPCSKSMSGLVSDGYLAKYRVFTIPMEDLEAEIESHGGDFVMESMSKYMRNQNVIKRCINQYETHAKGRSMIVYCVDKKHTVQMKKAYDLAGYDKSVIIDDSVSESDREIIFNKFAIGEIEIIFCIETLTEGLDLPNCNAIQLARPTKSMILYLQMVGRALRPKDNGGDAVILDSALNVSRLGMPTSDISWDLSGKRLKKQIKKGIITVYKDADGKMSFTNNEDVPHAEMVEVGFGELGELSESMISMGEEQNRKLYFEYYTSFKELCLHILINSGVKLLDIIEDGNINEANASDYNCKSFSFTLKNIKNINFGMEACGKDKDLIKLDVSGMYTYNDNNLEGYITKNKIKSIIGNVAEYINKDIRNIMRNMITIRIDHDDIQDIRELKRIKNELMISNINHNIEVQLAKEGVAYIALSRNFRLNDYATSLNHEIAKYLCIVNQKQLQVNNRVIFLGKYNENDSNYVALHSTKSAKKERLEDIIRDYDGYVVSDISIFSNITNHMEIINS